MRIARISAVAVAVMAVGAGFAAETTNLEAFREARFGMFIHWGLYAQLGGRYKGQVMPEKIGEWIQSSFRIPNAEYSRLAETFNPTAFDADAWAKAAKDAGMEYVVLTTKHHEGFSMFATKASDYNVVDATPFKRDVFGELAAACRRQGLKVGLYYSQNLDWHEPDGGDPRNVKGQGQYPNGRMDWGNTWDFPDLAKKDLDRYLKAKVYPQLKELLTNYGEIFLIWFDTSFGMTPQQSRELRDYVRSLSPKTIVNSRIGNGCGDFGSMGDNELVTNRCDFVRESAITMNDTWGFRYDDHNWKSAYTVATFLAQNLSHGANVILNVGPRPDGRFPDATCDVLAELGAWQHRTGFRIRGTGPGPLGENLPWGWCLSGDDGTIQLVIRREWKGDIVLKGLGRDGGDLVVTPPDEPDPMPRVMRLNLRSNDVEVRTVQDSPRYNAWPMIQTVGEKLVCAYSVGDRHSIGDGERGGYARVSADGGRTWGPETLIANDPKWGELPEGVGRDKDGAMLLWCMCSDEQLYHHDLYRTTDGTTWTRLASLRLDVHPTQIMDVQNVDGRLVSLWFRCSYGGNGLNAWGTLESSDCGRSWHQTVIERLPSPKGLPTEQSVVYLGNGRFFGITRTEGAQGQLQIESVDGGKTWIKRKTNITDVFCSTPALVYDRETGRIYNYYYERGKGHLKRRIADLDAVAASPTDWPAPEILVTDDPPSIPGDCGNVKVVVQGDFHVAAYYTGSPRQTSIRICKVKLPETNRLMLWRDYSKDECGKGFSGTATYRTSFDWKGAPGERVVLDLGCVRHWAEVRVNGRSAGMVWCPPWSCDVSALVRPGKNELEIDATSSWFNRLVYEARHPELPHALWTIKGPSGKSDFRISGLIGPVVLRAEAAK